MTRVMALAAAMLVLVSQRAAATVYSWRAPDGALHFSNDADEVPAELSEEEVETFTTRILPRGAAAGDVGGDAAEAGAHAGASAALPGARSLETAYERGFDAGLRAGEQHLRDAVDLARVLAADARPLPYAAEAPAAYVPLERPPGVSVSIVRAPGFPWASEAYSSGVWPVWSPWYYGYYAPALVGRRFGGHHRFAHSRRGGLFTGKRLIHARLPGRGAKRR